MDRLFRLTCWLSLGALLACSHTYAPDIERTDDTVVDSSVCPVSRLEARRYRDVAEQSVPDDIGQRACVVDASQKLQAEAECANRANTDALEAALTERGLTPTNHRGGLGYTSALTWETPIGRVVDVPPEEAESVGGSRAVFLGYGGGISCSATSTLAAGTTEGFLARDESGRLVVVVPKPAVETRTYVTCTCFAGCGTEPPGPQPVLALLGDDEVIAGPVEVPYPAIAIVTTAVESQTCCCAP